LRQTEAQISAHYLAQPSVKPLSVQYDTERDGQSKLRIVVITIELLLSTAGAYLNAVATAATDPPRSTA
jgi:hypothetical protein